MPSRLVRAWGALPTEGKLAAVAAGCLLLTLLMPWYLIVLAVVILAAYAVTRSRAAHQPSSPETPPEPPRRASAPKRRVGTPQTPLGRLFADRPGWSGGPVGPFDPTAERQRPKRRSSKTNQLTVPLDK